VLEEVSFNVQKGETLAILGPSGCGKTSLLLAIAGEITPDAGEVRATGEGVLPPARGKLALIAQEDALLPWRSARGNVEFAMLASGRSGASARKGAPEWLHRLGLDQRFHDTFPSQLSGGMRKRVSLAAALAIEPALLLMDEPFSSLDLPARLQIYKVLRQLWAKTHTTCIFVTHDVAEAMILAPRLLVLTERPARVKAEHRLELSRNGDPQELFASREFYEEMRRIWRDLGRVVPASA
jgi:NitT/TauT family transport system ATP-binding protein